MQDGIKIVEDVLGASPRATVCEDMVTLAFSASSLAKGMPTFDSRSGSAASRPS